MSPETLSLSAGAACFLVHAALTLVVLRLPGRLSPVVRHAAVATVVHLAGTLAAASALGPLPYWPNAAVFWFGVVIYLFVYCAVYKSVSLRILSRLLLAPGHQAPFAEITDQFVLPEFRQRTEVMQQLGWAVVVDGRFRITDKGRRAAQRLALLQAFFGIQRSGLYG